MGQFFKTAKTNKEKNRRAELITAGVGTGLMVGSAGYNFLPEKIRLKTKEVNVPPISKQEKILLLHSHPAFGSGHKFQAEAFEKHLRSQGYENITSKAIQHFNPYFDEVKPILERVYADKRKVQANPHDPRNSDVVVNWVANEKADGRAASEHLANEIGKYDRVVSFTGDSSLYMGDSFPKTFFNAVRKSDKPFHLVFTDRATKAGDGWWDALGVTRGTRPIQNYTSIHTADDVAYDSYTKAHPTIKDKIRLNKGLTVDVGTNLNHVGESIADLKDRNLGLFVHGGSTGVNVVNTAKMLEKAHEEGHIDKDVLFNLGPNNTDETGKKYVRELADRVNASNKNYKFHVVDKLDKNTMNRAIRDADINFTAGGTSYEELGALGKPSLFTFSKESAEYSHPGTIADTDISGKISDIQRQGKENKLKQVLDTPIRHLDDSISKKRGIGHLTGSDLIDTDNYDSFKKQFLEFKGSFDERKSIAEANKHKIGHGAESLLEDLSKGGVAKKFLGNKVHPNLLVGASLVGGSAVGLAGGSYLYHKIKDKKRERNIVNEAKEHPEASVPAAIAAGAAGIALVHGTSAAREIKKIDTKMIGPQSIKTYIDVARAELGVSQSAVAKTIKKLRGK